MKTRSQYRILIADDDVDIRRFSFSILTQGGYVVSTVADGADAWQALNAVRFDLLITDNHMPELTGVGARHAGHLPIQFRPDRTSDRPRRAHLELRSVNVRPTTIATAPPISIHTALSVGDPVKKRDTSELKEFVAVIPKTTSTTPPTIRKMETGLFIYISLISR